MESHIALFAGLVLVSAASSFCDQWMTSRLAQRVIFDVRRAMFAHFQDVALTFMDKTHVGRIMSRLQGDVNALQEFLESSTGALGDFTTLFGYAAVLIWMDWRLGLLTLTTIPALIAVRTVWLPFSKATFRRARDASSIANGALAENINGVRTVQESRREALNFELYEEKARENFEAQVELSWLAWPIGQMVKAQAGVQENDPLEVAREKVWASVESAVAEDDRVWIAQHLLPLVGGEQLESTGPRDESFSAWRRYFEGLADQRPLVLVFEDLHWADEGLLDFIDQLADWSSGVPLLVVGTARPELLDRRPGWGGGQAELHDPCVDAAGRYRGGPDHRRGPPTGAAAGRHTASAARARRWEPALRRAVRAPVCGTRLDGRPAGDDPGDHRGSSGRSRSR